MNSWALAIVAVAITSVSVAITSVSVAVSFPYAILSPIVPAKRVSS